MTANSMGVLIAAHSELTAISALIRTSFRKSTLLSRANLAAITGRAVCGARAAVSALNTSDDNN